MDMTQIGTTAALGLQSPLPSNAPVAGVVPVQAVTSEHSSPSGASASAQPTPQQVQAAVDVSNKVLQSKTSSELEFSVEKGTGMTVVKLIDRQSGDVLMQFPSQQMLDIAKTIDQVTGAIIQQTA